MTKIDLDELDRQLRAPCAECDAPDDHCPECGKPYPSEHGVTVMTALIARIRELESAVRESAEEFLRNSEYPPEVDDLYALLEKGAVLP
jgi:methionyl-tRNA synthetase